MKIAVIGTGYVGLTTVASLGELGHRMIGVDVDEFKIQQLTSGKLPLYEPDLEPVIQTLLDEGKLYFSTKIQEAIVQSEVIFIAVGTPALSDGRPNLKYVEEVAADIGTYITERKVIVNKSTVPVGTADYVKSIIREQLMFRGVTVDFDVVSNPEFLQEGKALQNARNPDRIVLGCSSYEAGQTMLELYQRIDCPKQITSPRDAEMIKYASNGFLAAKITFINEMARLCDQLSVDVTEVAKGMGADARIGPKFLQAGIGYGGSCFPKDTSALVMMGREANIKMSLLESVQVVNHTQVNWFVSKIKQKLGDLEGKRFALLGLAFKPNTDDIREAPSIRLHRMLTEEAAVVQGYDPAANLNMKQWVPHMNIMDNAYQASRNADAVIICTEWKEFADLDWHKIKRLMKGNIIFDGRNYLDRDLLKQLGFDYLGVGRR